MIFDVVYEVWNNISEAKRVVIVQADAATADDAVTEANIEAAALWPSDTYRVVHVSPTPSGYEEDGDDPEASPAASQIAYLEGEVATNVQDALARAITGVANIAALRAVKTRGLSSGHAIMVRGYYADGDEGGGLFLWDAASTATQDGGLVIRPDDVTAIQAGRWMRFLLTPELNVRWFGAKGDGTTNDAPAIQKVLDAIRDRGGGTIVFPPGIYRKAKTSAQLKVYPDTEWRGHGDISVFYLDDDTAMARVDGITITDTTGVAIRNMKFLGNADAAAGSLTNRSCMITGTRIKNLTLEDVHFEGVRYISLALSHLDGAFYNRVRLTRCTGDGLRSVHSNNVIISDIHAREVTDDVISFHTQDEPPAGWTGPHPSGLIVKGGHFIKCQGIKSLGARRVTLSDLHFKLCLRSPIYMAVPGSGAEGNRPMRSIALNNITLENCFGAFGTNYDIYIGAYRYKFPAGGPYPGLKDPIFDVEALNNIDAGNTNPGSHDIRLTNITISRTLPEVEKFSDYGEGLLYDRVAAPEGAGWATDPAITNAHFSRHGIVLQGVEQSVLLSNIQCSGGSTGTRAVLIHASTTSTLGYPEQEDMLIDNLIVRDWPGGGISVVGGSAAAPARNIRIKDSILDLDPYFRMPGHNPDNTWEEDAQCIGIDNGTTHIGVIVTGVQFQNLCRPIRNPSACYQRDNFYICDPVEVANNAANKGIRWLSKNGSPIIIRCDGDPTSPTFGARANMPLTASASMPTSGWYPEGHFVMSTDSTISSGKFLWGWKRLTTGTGHVLDTDWVAIYGSTS